MHSGDLHNRTHAQDTRHTKPIRPQTKAMETRGHTMTDTSDNRAIDMDGHRMAGMRGLAAIAMRADTNRCTRVHKEQHIPSALEVTSPHRHRLIAASSDRLTSVLARCLDLNSFSCVSRFLRSCSCSLHLWFCSRRYWFCSSSCRTRQYGESKVTTGPPGRHLRARSWSSKSIYEGEWLPFYLFLVFFTYLIIRSDGWFCDA